MVKLWYIVVGVVLVTLGIFGYLVPMLFSANCTELVILGVVVILGYVNVMYLIIKSVLKQNFFKESKVEN